MRSCAARVTIGPGLLELLPFESRFAFAAMLLAPGVNPNNFSAYGSGGESSNAFLLDGAKMNDPETGASWVFANYHWIERLTVSRWGPTGWPSLSWGCSLRNETSVAVISAALKPAR